MPIYIINVFIPIFIKVTEEETVLTDSLFIQSFILDLFVCVLIVLGLVFRDSKWFAFVIGFLKTHILLMKSEKNFVIH